MTIVDDLIKIQRIYGCCPDCRSWFLEVNFEYERLARDNEQVEIGLCVNYPGLKPLGL